MRVNRRTFLKAVSSLFGTKAFAQVPNPPTNLTIDGVGGGSVGGDSTLAELAGNMSMGQWAQLTSVANQNSVIGSQEGNSGSLITYSNAVEWNPLNQSIEFVGGDHNGGPTTDTWKRHVRYSAATNAWTTVQSGRVIPNIGHAYDHNAVNPFTGDLYHTNYSGFTGSIPVFRKTFGAGSFSLLTNLSASDQVSHGAAWWSGAFSGAGVQGCLVVYDCGNSNGQLRCFDPLSESVIYSNNSAAPGSAGDSYHPVLEYSDIKNLAVYGGGNFGNEHKLWRIDSNGTITPMPRSPVPVGVLLGNFVADPVTGNFLLMGSGQLWELNPDGPGSWVRKASPPAAVGDPTDSGYVISCPIPPYGVVAYITQAGYSEGNFYLYKPS